MELVRNVQNILILMKILTLCSMGILTPNGYVLKIHVILEKY